jgi:hypothetical protein
LPIIPFHGQQRFQGGGNTTMTTLASSISQIAPFVWEAKVDARRVVSNSESPRADLYVVYQIFADTLRLRRRFSTLTRKQARVISSLVQRQFSTTPIDEMQRLAVCIDELVLDERDLLKLAYRVGCELRVWWGTSLEKLSAQVEHLDSISKSIHLECSREVSISLDTLRSTNV